MVGRKQSIKVGDAGGLLGETGGGNLAELAGAAAAGGVTGTVTNLASNPTTDSANHANPGVTWFGKSSVRHFMRLCSVASLISVCANTDRTFSIYPSLMLITFVVDIITGIVFTIEMVFKIYSNGFLSGPKPYARDRWCQFDATMVLCIWISILLQVSSSQRGRCL